MAYVLAANQGATLDHYPPFSWPGGSMVVDYDGRLLAQADPGPGEKIVVSQVDIGALRYERERRSMHQPLVHLRSEAYPMYARTFYPQGSYTAEKNHPFAMNEERMRKAKENQAKQ